MDAVSWTVWLVRLVIGLVLTALLAWGISFKVSDYVVKANTSSANEAMRTLQSSIDQLNQSIQQNITATNGLQEQMASLLAASSRHTSELASMKDDLVRVTTAVQDSGIDIKIAHEGMSTPSKLLSWTDFRAFYGVAPDEPVFLEIPGVFD
ncbi:hypothetical protein [uncultured Roseovarius sp.]|uniref:hypothetical protein n=1 Tax=uncultured Roseovarius sp. TaxID=293344 RepID=UPI002610E21D|nr:hypothetical protein [uncultured Roseovarius sp.]